MSSSACSCNNELQQRSFPLGTPLFCSKGMPNSPTRCAFSCSSNITEEHYMTLALHCTAIYTLPMLLLQQLQELA
eukprot:6096-Heterococcus_DN1.PRE.2